MSQKRIEYFASRTVEALIRILIISADAAIAAATGILVSTAMVIFHGISDERCMARSELLLYEVPTRRSIHPYIVVGSIQSVAER